jgi:hypothetical protein
MSSDVIASGSVLFCLGGLYILTSACMIAFNKYLIHEGRFPFAFPLVFVHSGFSSICAVLLLLIKPSLFPSLTSPTERVNIDRDLVVRSVLPIALLFSAQLVLTNTAYLHSSMAFLQMMKEANLVLVYGLSLLAAMEVFCWMRLKVIGAIVFATLLTIHGELNFSWTGFALQGSSQFFESTKIVLQVMLLSNAGRKLDVLTYVLLVMPLCCLILGSMLLFLTYVHPIEHIATPQWSDIVTWWPQIAANACIAFALNLSIALFMKKSSAVGFILAGIAKDAIIVIAGVFVLGESMSNLQLLGFSTQLGLIWLWSLMKIFPDTFEGGLLAGLMLLTAPRAESKSLLTPERKSLLTPEPLTECVLQTRSYGASENKGGSSEEC